MELEFKPSLSDSKLITEELHASPLNPQISI